MKILSYGDNPKMSSGYGCVWDNLLSRWAKLKPDWEFYHCGWQSHDRKHITADGYYMLPINKVEYGFDTLPKYLKEINPDFLITLADVGVTSGYLEPLFKARQNGWKGKWISYIPLDTDSWEYLVWDKVFENANINVAMADWGFEVFGKHKVHDLYVIPHGVDTKIYHPSETRKELRKRFKIDELFVAGFVGRNQRRKMVANLLKGFAQFSKGRDDVRLLLHTDVLPPSGAGWVMPAVLQKFANEIDPNLTKQNKVIMTKDNLDPRVRQGITPTEMNDIYNLMDVFCFPTGGEGFGLPAIECQAAGVPLMMTDFSTARELCGNHGVLIPVLKDEYGRDVKEIGSNGIENAIPNDVELAKLLEEAYEDWKKGTLKRKEAREFALKYDWDLIAPKWISLMKQNA